MTPTANTANGLLDSDWRKRIDTRLLEVVADVDRALLRWSQGLSVRERLRAVSTAGSVLHRYRREDAEAG